MLKHFITQIKHFFDAKLPFEILEEFKPLSQSMIDEKGSFFEEANSTVVKIDIKEKSNAIVSFIFLFIFLLLFLFFGKDIEEGLAHPVMILIISILSVSCIYFFVKIFIKQKAYIILNRETGLFTFPYRINKYKSYVLPFNDAIVFWVGTGGVTGNLGIELVAQHPDKKIGGSSLEAHETNFRKIWSFYVWYMDKNRPLPPGTAFDAYRQQDFERRKAEGFPKPLYRSHIPTPEATEEQQAERDACWKEDLEDFTREADSMIYDPEIHKDWIHVRFMKSKDTPIAHTYYRFEFEDGRIVYVKTDENGRGFEPPKTEKFTGEQIELTESWF